MSKQITKTIFGANINILAVGDHFVNVPIKVAASTIVANSDGKKILAAGSIVNKIGVVVNDNTAYGFVYEDVDFTNSTGTETVPVTIHGFIDKTNIPTEPTAAALAVMPQIIML